MVGAYRSPHARQSRFLRREKREGRKEGTSMTTGRRRLARCRLACSRMLNLLCRRRAGAHLSIVYIDSAYSARNFEILRSKTRGGEKPRYFRTQSPVDIERASQWSANCRMESR